jgi:hypothetical protein
MIQWKVDIAKVGDGAVLERAKIEAARMQCELLQEQNEILKKILRDIDNKK